MPCFNEGSVRKNTDKLENLNINLMEIRTHDPAEYIRGIQQILVSDKKRIGFLFGAGSSLASKNGNSITVPAIGKMTEEVVKELSELNGSYQNALDEIKIELDGNFNIETILSNLEQKEKLIGNNKLNGLERIGFQDLIKEIKDSVRKKVSVHLNKKNPVNKDTVSNMVQTDFANWIGQAERKYPVEIFTTNYDYLFELGLEYREIPYYDGFCGSFKPFFNPESIEDLTFLSGQTKLWKIHGSLGWHYDLESEKIIRSNTDDQDILIYPSSLKYVNSKKQPYESLMDRLSNFLKTDDAILITCGYSWGDEHINARIISALKTNTTSHVIGLVYDKSKDEKGNFLFNLSEDSDLVSIGLSNPKISLYGGRTAVIGCKFGEWKLKKEPDIDDTIQINLYFDEDAPIDEDDELNIEKEGGQKWTGKGEFILPNFTNLVRFLNEMINENEIKVIGKDGKK